MGSPPLARNQSDKFFPRSQPKINIHISLKIFFNIFLSADSSRSNFSRALKRKNFSMLFFPPETNSNITLSFTRTAKISWADNEIKSCTMFAYLLYCQQQTARWISHRNAIRLWALRLWNSRIVIKHRLSFKERVEIPNKSS